jgi:arylsulfatase A-like enzyme
MAQSKNCQDVEKGSIWPMQRSVLLSMFAAFALIFIGSAVSAQTEFKGTIARAAKDSTPAWPKQNIAPEGAPNIAVILLDDIGFADTSLFGGLAETPNLKKLAENGLRYNNFNVTAMCSPTRAALLTGRNHHRVGFGIISEGANGYPGYNSYWNESTASVAEVLRQNGYSTAAIGKWHNTPDWEITPVGPFDRWPTGLGFEHFYGFMGAEDNHWAPNRLYRDTTPIDAPSRKDGAYHLTTDLADRAISWVDRHRSLAPEKPYFLYFATGAVHSPHHAPADWVTRYHGKFDRGWDKLRNEVFARQKQLGVIPVDAELTPRPAQVPAWDTLNKDQQRLFARQMEVYAAFVAHTDYQVGRLLEHIRNGSERGENTLIFYVAGDNGALGRPLPNYGGAATLAEDLARIDDLGGPQVPFNQSQGGWGWMGNTPFQYWKTVASHLGGLRAPMVVSWPARIKDDGGLRQQFQHVTDIVPTIYDAIGVKPPSNVKGVAQEPMDGASLLSTMFDRSASSAHDTQYFELSGSRAIYHNGWMASALPRFMAPDGNEDAWELYNLEEDFTQARDLAKQNPAKLAELKALFDQEAQANYVYPLMGAAWSPLEKPFPANSRMRFDFFQGAGRVPPAQLPSFNQSFSLEAEVLFPRTGASGTLSTFGFVNKGFAWYIQDGRLVYENRQGVNRDILKTERRVPGGLVSLRYEFVCDTCEAKGRSLKPISGTARLLINGEVAAEQVLEVVDFTNSGEAFALYIGRTGGSRITDAFEAPFSLNGQLTRLTITID